jgi:POT family proton-dependent oligopeptide transporter
MTLHALLVLVLAPPLGWGLARLQRRGSEISTPGKMACGFVATSAAFLVMERAAVQGGDQGQVHLVWLSGCYVLLTIGELLLAPMGLALVTRLAPPERASRMVALWCVATAVGNALAGALGLLWTRWPHHRYFALLAMLALGAAVVLLARMRGLERLLRAECASRAPDHGVGDRTDGQQG